MLGQYLCTTKKNHVQSHNQSVINVLARNQCKLSIPRFLKFLSLVNSNHFSLLNYPKMRKQLRHFNNSFHSTRGEYVTGTLFQTSKLTKMAKNAPLYDRFYSQFCSPLQPLQPPRFAVGYVSLRGSLGKPPGPRPYKSHCNHYMLFFILFLSLLSLSPLLLPPTLNQRSLSINIVSRLELTVNTQRPTARVTQVL